MDGESTGRIAATEPRRSIDLELLERDMQQLVTEAKAPGLSVSLKLGDYGANLAVGMRCMAPAKPISTETRFPSACVMKSLVALAACELHVRGELDVNRPVAAYLPELDNGRSIETPITLAHLMSHTGGYIEPQTDDVRWAMDFDEFARAFRSAEQAFKPGTVWGYSQTGSAIVGRVIEKVTGEDVLDIIRRDLLEPLDISLGNDFQDPSADVAAPHIMTRLGYRPIKLPPESALLRHSISARTVRASDLLAIGGLIAGDVRPDFLSEEAYRLFSTPIITVPETSGGGRKEVTPTFYGCGRALYGRLVGQTGSYAGATNTVRVDPVTGARVAVCVVGWLPGFRDHLISYLLHRMTGDEAIVSKSRCRIDRPIEAWAGTYTSLMLGGGTAQLDLQTDGKLRCVVKLPMGGDFEATLWSDDTGNVRGKVNQSHLALALNYSAENDEPYLMIGTMAYKRTSSSQ